MKDVGIAILHLQRYILFYTARSREGLDGVDTRARRMDMQKRSESKVSLSQKIVAIQEIMFCTFQLSGKIKDSCQRPTQHASLVIFNLLPSQLDPS